MSEETRAAIAQAVASAQSAPAPEPTSEPAPSSEEPTPSSTADDLDALPGPDGEADLGAVDAPESKLTETTEPKKEAAKVEEDDDFDKVAEFEELSNGVKRVNRIPQPRVKKMIEKKVAAAEAALREALGKEHGEKLTKAEKRIAEMDAIGEIMGTQPERFMEMLAQANPEYKKYSKGDSGAKPAAAAQDANDPEPQPDGKLPDGTPGYTEAQWAKREEWRERQVEKRAVAAAEKRMQEKYGWIDKEREAKQAHEATRATVREQVAAAVQSFPDFEQNFEAILGELRADTEESEKTGQPVKLHNVREAYFAHRDKARTAEIDALKKENDKLKGDRNKIREEVIAELKGRPTATDATPATHVAGKNPTSAVDDPNKTTADVIREAMAKAGRRGAAA